MAASTAETESAQALFCALADFTSDKPTKDILNLEKYPTFWHFAGYTEKNAKGYKKALKEAYVIEKRNNKETRPFTDWEQEITSPKLLELINTQRKKNLSISKDDWKNNNEYLKKADKDTIVNIKTLAKLKQVLDDELGWYESSVKIAAKLLKNLKRIDPQYDIKGAGCQMTYYRGEKENPIMGVIGELFKKANDAEKESEKAGVKNALSLGDINKWSPADIYFATDKAKTDLQTLNKNKGGLDFPSLNKMIADQINDGQLLPLSLKKVKDDVHLVKVNWNPQVKQGILNSVKYTGASEIHLMKSNEKGKDIYTTSGNNFQWGMPSDGKGPIYPRSSKVDGKTIAYRDFFLYFTVLESFVGTSGLHKQGVSLQFRHTPASGGKPQKGLKVVLGYEGLNAVSAGQVTTIEGLCKLIAVHDSDFASKLEKDYLDRIKDFKTVANDYINTITPPRFWNKSFQFGRRKLGDALYRGKYPDFMSDYLAQYQQQVNPKATVVSWGTFNSTKNIHLTPKEQKTIFNEDMGAISGVTVMNGFRKTLDDYFKGPDTTGIKRDIIMEIYKYTSSRTDKSAKFVIAK
jgi:hypothetical protein